MEKYCSKLLDIMKLETINYIIIIALCVLAIIICFILRDNKIYKLLLWICAICLVISIGLYINVVGPIYSDYHNKSFVQMERVTVVSTASNGFDLSGIGEISILTSEGDIIQLKTTNQLPKGEYEVSIVYAEKSNYLLDWKITEQ